ncbi:MAG: DUF3990 domain-containing protein [Acholeplasmatales bacterium]|nr:DUF3990 domain-containing protein [Acholeplasmatales bacterium]
MILYHLGFDIIKDIDLRHGRINADFGQGFYLSNNIEFSKKWATIKNDRDTILNFYDLDLNSLNVLEFKERNKEWFDYIFKNRNGQSDIYKEYDVIIGPIANDTIFDLYGIVTSGLINNELALKILDIGPTYYQIVLKSEKAKSNIKFLKYEILDKLDIKNNQNEIRKIEEDYQDKVFNLLDDKVKDILS